MLNKELLCGCASPKLGIGELEVSYISDAAGDNILIEATFQDGTQKTITLLTWKDLSIVKVGAPIVRIKLTVDAAYVDIGDIVPKYSVSPNLESVFGKVAKPSIKELVAENPFAYENKVKMNVYTTYDAP